jgi:Uma2 family endonuclease
MTTSTAKAKRIMPPEGLYHRHPISVDIYHRMGEAGIIEPELRVELIKGELIDMAPIGSRHAGKVKRLLDVLTAQLHGRAIIAAQDPIVLGEYSEPQPDIAVLRFREDYYEQAHPSPTDIYLVIEVADTTVRYDREVKIPLYAEHGIPEAWLLDLEQKRLEIYHDPKEGEYQHVDFYRSGQVALQTFPSVAVDLREVLS